MNPINLLLAKNEQFKFVTCVFNVNQPSENQKAYTYKTLLNVNPGDLVVAPTAQGTFETVKVVEVGVEYKGSFEIKWIAAVLNLDHLAQCKAIEEDIKQLFVEEENRKRKVQTAALIEDAIGADGVTKAEQIAKRVRI